jgi:hypothetical protein
MWPFLVDTWELLLLLSDMLLNERERKNENEKKGRKESGSLARSVERE